MCHRLRLAQIWQGSVVTWLVQALSSAPGQNITNELHQINTEAMGFILLTHSQQREREREKSNIDLWLVVGHVAEVWGPWLLWRILSALLPGQRSRHLFSFSEKDDPLSLCYCSVSTTEVWWIFKPWRSAAQREQMCRVALSCVIWDGIVIIMFKDTKTDRVGVLLTGDFVSLHHQGHPLCWVEHFRLKEVMLPSTPSPLSLLHSLPLLPLPLLPPLVCQLSSPFFLYPSYSPSLPVRCCRCSCHSDQPIHVCLIFSPIITLLPENTNNSSPLGREGEGGRWMERDGEKKNCVREVNRSCRKGEGKGEISSSCFSREWIRLHRYTLWIG